MMKVFYFYFVFLFVGMLVDVSAQEKQSDGKVAIIDLKGMVDELMFTSLKRRMAVAKKRGAERFILTLDTFGGTVQSAEQIIDLVSEQKKEVVAFVKQRALSAGTMIAYGCSKVYVSPQGFIGDCGPLFPADFMVSDNERAKVVSYLVERIKQLARKSGYSEEAAAAMVDSSTALYSITITKGSQERAILIPEESLQDEIAKWENQGWAVISQSFVKKKGDFLTLDANSAFKFNLCSGIVEDETRLAEMLGYKGEAVLTIEMNWWEKFARFISSSPVILTLLLTIGGILVYIELKTPGFGIPGIVGITFLSVAFLSAYMGHLASIIELLMIIVGVILILLEIFVIPGFGVTGIAGILLLLAGMILSLQEFTIPKSIFELDILKRNFAIVFGSIVALGIGIALISRYLPRSRRFESLLVLTPAETEKVHATGAPQTSAISIGTIGVAETPLRPAGKARFKNELVDVTAEGEFIEAQTTIVVVETSSNRIVVRRVSK